ncbi:MAG: hypothetical protein NVV62_02330 [Terricaulis sp.]|nr:hypothetical protein [Terricaulis sp.]
MRNWAPTPIQDGAQYFWRLNGSNDTTEVLLFQYVRVGQQYDAYSLGSEHPDSRVTLVPVIETPANDYIAQVESRSGGIFYAFLWPVGDDRYIVPLSANYAGNYCTPIDQDICRFGSADDVVRYYVQAVYPTLANGDRPAHFVEVISAEQVPISEADSE